VPEQEYVDVGVFFRPEPSEGSVQRKSFPDAVIGASADAHIEKTGVDSNRQGNGVAIRPGMAGG